jgi:hypothetical protein
MGVDFELRLRVYDPNISQMASSLNRLNRPTSAIAERILLDIGWVGEAYEKYALTANGSSGQSARPSCITRKIHARKSLAAALGA